MAGRIQGITVEIGGDTTKLQTERLSIKRRSGLDEMDADDIQRKLRPIAFDPFDNAYVGIGEKVGNAFSDGAKLK